MPTQSFKHGRNTCHSVKVTGGPASSPPLDLLNLSSFHLSIGVPNGRSIFELRPDQCIVGGLSHSRHFCSDISLYEKLFIIDLHIFFINWYSFFNDAVKDF